jgi:signal transduction histidine kinase
MAIAALLLLILSPAWIFYNAYNASMQEQHVFALVVIFAALAAGLAGFGLAELLLRATFEKKAKDRTPALSTSDEQLRATIAELQAAKLHAEAASKAKSDFLANMSHELRTPLNAIIGFSDVMKSQILGPIGNRTYLDYAADINFSGKHLLEIINDILDVVRHESGKMELKEEVVDVEAVINEARRLVAPQALQGEVELTWRAPASALPPLFCDRVRLRQMLLNILSNAVKFTGPGGSVEIAAELTDGLQLIVKDSGVGIKPEDIARIMTPFGQVDTEYSRHHQGTGLGLTLTKALVERHGGRLSLISVPDVGTTVRLSFPAERLARQPVGPDMTVGRGVSD